MIGCYNVYILFYTKNTIGESKTSRLNELNALVLLISASTFAFFYPFLFCSLLKASFCM